MLTQTFALVSPLLLSLALGCITPTVEEYFPELAEDHTQVMWSRSTNTASELEAAIFGPTHMIGADVILGLEGDPVMGRSLSYDVHEILNLDLFLQFIIQATKDGPARNGIKLCFQSTEAVKPTLEQLRNLCSDLNMPVWLHGDVVTLGRAEGEREGPIDPDTFTSLAKTLLPSAQLSFGFAGNCSQNYSSEDFYNMMAIITRNRLVNPVTVSLRACSIPRSLPQIKQFVKTLENEGPKGSSIAIYSEEKDKVDLDTVHRSSLPSSPQSVYLDVPTDLRWRLIQLAGGSSLAVSISLPLLILLAASSVARAVALSA